MIESYANNLRKLTALKLDWGRNEEFGFIPGESLMFSQKLENLGIHHYAEEYLGMHSDRYKEHIKLHSVDGYHGTTALMLLEIRNDTLIQKWPVDENWMLPEEYALEKWIRLE